MSKRKPARTNQGAVCIQEPVFRTARDMRFRYSTVDHTWPGPSIQRASQGASIRCLPARAHIWFRFISQILD
jgi:hypothetical protein